MGRKGKFDYTDPMFLLEIEGYARRGLSDLEISKNIGLGETHFSRVKSKYPQLSQAIKKGRQPLNVIVENALFKRATGMKSKSVTRRWIVNPDGTNGLVEIVQETETDLPPDTGAAMAWLKNRDPEQWNKQAEKIQHSGAIENVIKIGYAPKEE